MAAPKMLKDSVYSQRKQNLKLQRVNVEFIQLKKYFLVKNSIYIQNTGACAIKIKRKHYRELDWKAKKINVTIFYITPNIHILIRKKKKKSFHRGSKGIIPFLIALATLDQAIV